MDRWDIDLCDPEVFKDPSVPGFVCIHKDAKNLSNQMTPVSFWIRGHEEGKELKLGEESRGEGEKLSGGYGRAVVGCKKQGPHGSPKDAAKSPVTGAAPHPWSLAWHHRPRAGCHPHNCRRSGSPTLASQSLGRNSNFPSLCLSFLICKVVVLTGLAL